MAFTKRGLRLVEALAKYSKDKPMYYDTNNFFNKIDFITANEEQLKATWTVDSSMCNGYDIMHGGFMALVVDAMCLYAHVVQTDGKMAYTTNISVNFIGTVSVGDKVIAAARTLKGGNSSVMESTIHKENGTLVAKGTACFVNGRETLQSLAKKIIGFDVLDNDD